MTENRTIDGTLNLNGKTVDMQDAEDSISYSTINTGSLKGTGNLKINVNMNNVGNKAENSDKINITDGAKNNAVVNLVAINVENDIISSASPYKDYVDYITGNKTGLTYQLSGSTSGSIISVTDRNKYTFTKGTDGSLDVFVESVAAGLREYINGSLIADSYSINEDYLMEDNLPIGTTANGNTKNVFINNAASLVGFGGTDGITVANGYVLNLTGSKVSDKTSTMKNFNTALNNLAGGTLNIENMKFENNTVDIANAGELNLSGNNLFNSGIIGNGTTNINEGRTVSLGSVSQNDLNILSDATLNINADNLNILNGVSNKGNLELTGGTLTSAVNGNGKTNIDGDVIANAIINNEIIINDLKKLTLSADNIGNTLTNETGTLVLTDCVLTNNINGSGNTVINGDVSFGNLIDGVLNKISIEASSKLTSNADKLGNEDIENKGSLILTGDNSTLKNVLNGSGTTVIDGVGINGNSVINNRIKINNDKSLNISADNVANTADTSLSGIINLTGGTLLKSVLGSGYTTVNGDVSVDDVNGSITNNIKIESGKLTSNAANIGLNDILNNSVLEISGGNLNNNIGGINGSLDIIGDVTNNNGKMVSQKYLKILNGKSFKSAADKITISGEIKNDGTLTLTGSNIANSNKVVGDGLLNIDGNITQTDGYTIANTVNIVGSSTFTTNANSILNTITNNSGTLNLNGGTLTSSVDGNGITNITGSVTANEIISNVINIIGSNSLTADSSNIGNNVSNESGMLILTGGTLNKNVTGSGNAVIDGSVTVADGGISNKIEIKQNSILTSNAEKLGGEDIKNAGVLKLTGCNISNNITDNTGVLNIVGNVTNTADKSITQGNLNIGINSDFTTSVGTLNIANVIENNGSFTLEGTGVNNNAISGNGTFNVDGNISQSALISGGTTNILGNSVLDINAGLLGSSTIKNDGTVKLGDGILSEIISGNGNIEIKTASTVSSSLGNLASTGKLTNNGILNLTGDITRDIAGNGSTILNTDDTKIVDSRVISGNLDMNGKTINMQDSPTKYSELNVGSLSGTGNLKIDADMAKNVDGKATASDKLNIGGALSGTVLNISDVKVTNPTAVSDRGTYSDYLTYATGDLSNVEQRLAGSSGSNAKYTTTDGTNQYIFTLGSDGKLNAEIDHIAISLKDYVQGATDYAKTLNSYNVNSDMTINENIGATAEGDSRVGGTTLRINVNNGSNIKASGNKNIDGITVADGYDLILDGSNEDGAKMSNFKTALVNNGTLNIDSMTFEGNETDIVNNATLNFDGINNINSGIKGDSGVTNIKSGTTNANASFIQKIINVLTDATLKGNADNLIANNGIKNEGTLDLTGGSLSSDVKGNGTLNVSENTSISNGTTVSQAKTNVSNGKTLSNNGALNTSLDLKNGQSIDGNGMLNLVDNSTNAGSITQNNIVNSDGKTFTNKGSVSANSVENKGVIDNTSSTASIVSSNIKNTENGMLTSRADNLVSSNGIVNDGNLDFTDGNLSSDVKGNGTTEISGNVTNTNGKSIAQKIFNIITGGLFETDADKISTENNVVKNNGTLKFTGNAINKNNIYGTGTTEISGNITQTDGSIIATDIKVDDSAALTIGASDVQGNINKESNSNLTLKSGILNKNITGNGSTEITGTVNSKGDITQDNLLINSSSEFLAEGVINSNVDNKGTTVANSKINGNIKNTGNFTSNSDIVGSVSNEDGVINFNGTVSGSVSSTGGILNFSTGTIDSTGVNPLASLTLNGAELNISDSKVNTLVVHAMNLTGENKLKLDADLKNKQMDKLQIKDVINSNINPASTITITGVKLLSDATVKKLSLPIFEDEATKVALINNIRANLKGVQYSNLYKYDVDYDKINGLVNFNRYSTGGYEDFNPSIVASPIAAQVGGYLTQLNIYEQAFSNMDMTMVMTKKQRLAMKYANKYASSQGSAQGGVVTFSPNQQPEQDKGLWFRPFTTFESVGLKNGPKVNNTAYGSLFGGDSDLTELSHGWDMTYSVYAGYIGSHQTYDGIGIYQNGAALGTSAAWYKGNFYTGLTVNVGTNIVDASTLSGSDDFTMLQAGIASKTGYNFEFADGKFIVQPNYLMSYTLVNTFDYTNGAGVRIKSDPLNAIQLAPGVKFIGNLEKGWQPYASVQMMWNLMDKTDFKANDVSLPNLSVKPYVQYGVGVQKHYGDSFTAFGQTMLRNGGRNGISFQFGLRWTLGKNNKTKNINKPKT